MDKKVIIECLLAIGIYIVSLLFWFFVFWVKKRIKWYRAKKRGLERFPIGSTVIRNTADGPVQFKVLDVWASRSRYEDAFCVRFEDEQGTKFRMVEGEPGLGGFKLLKYSEPTKLD